MIAKKTFQKLLEIKYQKSPLLDLTFDDGNQEKFVDLRPLNSNFIEVLICYFLVIYA